MRLIFKGPRATSNHSLPCANHNPLQSCGLGLEIFPDQGNRGCSHSGCLLQFGCFLTACPAVQRCCKTPVHLRECSECDIKDKRKGGKEKETEEWRDAVLGEGLKKSDAGSTPCCWSGWESPCFAGLLPAPQQWDGHS